VAGGPEHERTRYLGTTSLGAGVRGGFAFTTEGYIAARMIDRHGRVGAPKLSDVGYGGGYYVSPKLEIAQHDLPAGADNDPRQFGEGQLLHLQNNPAPGGPRSRPTSTMSRERTVHPT
jgi:hypothetical protein